MMIFKKSIPRRSFLRGAGVTVALPLLDAMFPALAATRDKQEAARRFSVVYTPNGMNMPNWTPGSTGKSFELSPTLSPLQAYREQLLVMSGLDNNAGDPLPGEGEVAPHERAGGVFLTGTHPLKEGHVGTSIDQIIAAEFGKHTQLTSLELGLHNTDIVGSCEKGWSCAYRSTLSWRTPTTPLPVEYRPRVVFERLFGDSSSTDPAVRLARIQREKSILDSVTEAVVDLKRSLGSGDNLRLTEYLDGMRDVERRIQMAEQQSSRDIPSVERPDRVPPEFADHLKMMFDLKVLAFQSDMTRVTTLMVGPEQGNWTYEAIGIPEVHHSLSHHQGNPEKNAKVARIDHYHAELLTYYLDKLRSTEDIDGSLLDNIVILYGSGISDGNDHLVQNLPVVLLGGAGGKLKGGRHLVFPKGTPMTNMYLSLLDRFNIPLDTFGDSTGRLDMPTIA